MEDVGEAREAEGDAGGTTAIGEPRVREPGWPGVGELGVTAGGRVKSAGSLAAAFEPVERARLRPLVASGSEGANGGDAGVVGVRVRGCLPLADAEPAAVTETRGGEGDCTLGGGGGEMARAGGGGGDIARVAMSGRGSSGSLATRF